MEHIAIKATPREASASKGERNRLRRAGHIPAAVFGKGIEEELVTVEARDIAAVLSSEAGINTLIDLTVKGKRHLVKLAQVEIDPLSRNFLHVGLHKINAREPQKASVPVQMDGEPEVVNLGDGLLDQVNLTIDIRALPDKIPANLSLDISGMQVGDVLYASNVELPEGVELISPEDTVIVSLQVAKVLEVEPETTEEPAEGEGEEAAEDAEGAEAENNAE